MSYPFPQPSREWKPKLHIRRCESEGSPLLAAASKMRFASEISLTLPGGLAKGVEVPGVASPPTYVRATFGLAYFLGQQAHSELLLHGGVSGVSIDGGEEDDRAMVDGGVLWLHVGKDLYERLGLPGKALEKRRFHGSTHQTVHWLIRLDMRAPEMLPGGGMLGRVRRAFEEVWTEELSWELLMDGPGGGGHTFAPACQATEHTCRVGRVTRTEILIPEVPQGFWEEEMRTGMWEQGAEDVEEWLGLVAIGSERIQAADRVDAFISGYTLPVQFERRMGNAEYICLGGLLPPSSVEAMLSFARHQVKIGAYPWASVTVRQHVGILVDGGGKRTPLQRDAPRPNYSTLLVTPKHDFAFGPV